MRRFRIVRKTIRPPEVSGIAARFRAAASQIREQAANAETVARQLEPTWEGNSKERFFAEYAPTPGQIRNCADTLDHLAAEIDNITVEIEVAEYY